jgi:protein involved in polysaccharide export with SLBB domain
MHEKESLVLSKNWARLSLAICLTALGTVAAQSQQAESMVPSSPPANSDRVSGSGAEREHSPMLRHRDRRYQLHSADVLELNFHFTPEFNQTVTVQPDGYITLRGVEGIRVEGQTIPEVTKSLQTAYTNILHDPVINVELKDFEKPYFIVGGEVGHPGKFDLRGETTATEAVAIAGGLRDSAKHSQVLLFRRVPGGWAQSTKINMKKMLHEANVDEDAQVQAGDFLYVPKNTLSKIERFIPTSSIGMYASPVLH